METNFNPIMEQIRVVRKNTRQNSAGSLKIKIPISTVPTAPTPVHTAYAVPIGKVCVALYKRSMLIVKQMKNPIIHHVAAVPELSFAFPRQVAKPTSNNPATIKIIQFILCILRKRVHVFKNYCFT